jgi:hypothetical protein
MLLLLPEKIGWFFCDDITHGPFPLASSFFGLWNKKKFPCRQMQQIAWLVEAFLPLYVVSVAENLLKMAAVHSGVFSYCKEKQLASQHLVKI